MSILFNSLFDLKAKDFNFELFVEQLKTSPAIARITEIYRDRWIPQVWELDVSTRGEPNIVGPGGFWFWFRPQTVKMHHVMRFSTFTGEMESRQSLRLACRAVAGYIGSARVIYTHELMPCKGNTLDQIEAGLRVKIGPPAESFEQLHEAADFAPRAWYIDTFAALGG
jgi:hypothetical protein